MASPATGPDRKEPGSLPLPSLASSCHEPPRSRRNLQKTSRKFQKIRTARSPSNRHQI
ncbi:unnamed protein product [Prunus brigantina]